MGLRCFDHEERSKSRLHPSFQRHENCYVSSERSIVTANGSDVIHQQVRNLPCQQSSTIVLLLALTLTLMLSSNSAHRQL